MADALKIRFEFRDLNEAYYAINLYERDWAGTAVVRELVGGFSLKWGDSAGDSFPTILGSMATWSFYAEDGDDFGYLYSSDKRKHRVEIRKDNATTGAVVWTGWLMIQEYEEPLAWQPVITVSARCGLGELKEATFEEMFPDADGRLSWFAMLRQMLASLDLGLNIHTAVNYRALEHASGDMLPQSFDDVMIYKEKKCDEVIKQLLTNCRVMQRDGAWYIEAYTALKQTTYTQYNYDYAGGALTPAFSTVTPRRAIDQSAVWTEGTPQLSRLPAFEKLVAKQDYALQQSYFKNKDIRTSDHWAADAGVALQHYDNDDDPYCLIEGIDASGATNGIAQSVAVKASSPTTLFSAKVAPLGWYARSSDAVAGTRTAMKGVQVKMQFKLVGASATYYLDNENGWQEGEAWLTDNFDSSVSGDISWNTIEVASSIPVDGTLTVRLCKTPHFVLGPSSVYSGVAWSDVVVFPKMEIAKSLTVTASNTGAYSDEADDISLLHGTISPEDNASLIWRGGITTTADRLNQTTGWYVDNTVETYGYSILMARMAMSLRRKHITVMDARVVGGYGTGCIYNEMNQPGIDYVMISGEWDARRDTFDGQWAELTVYDPDCCNVTTDYAKLSLSGRLSGSRTGITVINNYNSGASFDQIGGNPASNQQLVDYINNLLNSTTPDTQTIRISGAIVWKSGLTFRHSPLVYKYNGKPLTITENNNYGPLDAADPNLPRKDVFYVTQYGELLICKGTPAVNPVEPTNYVGLRWTVVDIPAGSLVPSNVNILQIYDEGNEWVAGSIVDTGITVNFADTDEPYNGTMCMSVALAIPDSIRQQMVHAVGEQYQGGIIIYTSRGSQQGIIAAAEPIGENFYQRLSDSAPYETGAQYRALYEGDNNMSLLANNVNAMNHAAGMVKAYRGGGYADWLMGSLADVAQLAVNKRFFAKNTVSVWTSTEAQNQSWKKAYAVDLRTGAQNRIDKNNRNQVWPFRYFDDATLPTNVPVTVYAPQQTEWWWDVPGGTPINVANIILSMNLRSSAPWRDDSQLAIELYNGATRVGGCVMSQSGYLYGYRHADEAWQLVAIQGYMFAPTSNQITRVKFITRGNWTNNIKLSLDDVRLQYDEVQGEADIMIPGTYGGSEKSLVVTYNAQGKATAAEEVPNVPALATVTLDRMGADTNALLAELAKDQVKPVPAATQEYSGTITRLTAAVAMAFGDVGYIQADGRVAMASAAAEATAVGCVMCVDASITVNAEGTFMLYGIARNDSWNLTVGGGAGILYLSTTGTTGNTLAQTVVSAEDNVSQILGFATAPTRVFFNPQLIQVVYKA